MEINQDIKDQQEYEVLLANVKNIEAEIMPQLEMLGKQIPEIYSGYANVVRTTVNEALKILSLKETTNGRIQLAAEIGARSLEAFGAWKAAREHNRMLDKFLTAKKRIADLNLSKIEIALKESEKNLIGVKKRFVSYSQIQYDLTSENNDTINRVSNLLLRQLVLYRTNLFLSNMCKYLKAEYKAWSNGQQTSKVAQPDYYLVNGEILKGLFTKDIFEVIEEAGDSQGQLKGSQIMLLSDPQLAVYALKDAIVKINYDNTSHPVGILLKNNPGLPYYLNQTEPLINEINKDSIYNIYLFAICAFIAVVCLCIWWIPGAWWTRLIIGIIATSGIYRITSKNSMKLKVMHITQTMESIAIVDDNIESYCGKVNLPEIDYTRKSAISAALKSFFN